MERLTRKIAGSVALSLIPMDIKNKEDLEIYHKVRKQYEENTIKLAEYEDLEEQGLLLRLPCKVGDIIYRVNTGAKEPVIKMRVLQVNYKQLHKDRIVIRIDAINDNDMRENCYLLEDIGKTVFLTQAEAEQKLKEMKDT